MQGRIRNRRRGLYPLLDDVTCIHVGLRQLSERLGLHDVGEGVVGRQAGRCRRRRVAVRAPTARAVRSAVVRVTGVGYRNVCEAGIGASGRAVGRHIIAAC